MVLGRTDRESGLLNGLSCQLGTNSPDFAVRSCHLNGFGSPHPLPSAWAFGDVSCKCCNSLFMKSRLNSVHIRSQSHRPHLLSRSLSFHNSILAFSEKSPAVLNGRSVLYYLGKEGTRQWGRRPIQNFIPVV
jgi:hypothetical protein